MCTAPVAGRLAANSVVLLHTLYMYAYLTNTGGKRFAASKSTLLSQKGSFFDAMLSSGNWKPGDDGAYVCCVCCVYLMVCVVCVACLVCLVFGCVVCST